MRLTRPFHNLTLQLLNSILLPNCDYLLPISSGGQMGGNAGMAWLGCSSTRATLLPTRKCTYETRKGQSYTDDLADPGDNQQLPVVTLNLTVAGPIRKIRDLYM
jgi:hypothetical protein